MKKHFISIGIGVIISGLGLFLIQIGGWGPCGPASTLAFIGGVLNMFHVIYYSTVFGELSTERPIINLTILFIIPAFDWAILSYIIMTAINFIKRGTVRENL
jgi:hypothetical protein